ncbi:DHA2 family efflux MFS transporter permease subunit [Microvirga alba]|uniref:DHA2 family efflux MFS transporter permease subunit n=1 Tax=Microvirga alba TaxID=2791025 RepID=A0A931BP48_9HYPH|nr:DHA2 family efflux MFS transporter permease subunit [Microvirga alba]MBF9234871.1 DHA2 family efflux MFS transporter permease subunit [Microvirga alba]
MDRPCPVEARSYVIWAAILASSLAFIDGTVITVAIPRMRESLGASLSQVQWITNAYALTLSALLLLGGAAGDAYGLKRIFMIGIGLFGLASLWCGLAGSADMLIAARSVQGIGGALMVPGSLALISTNFPPAERGKAIGTWAAASGIAAALGPILGGWLIDIGPWQAIFWINVPVAALALWLCWRHVPARPASADTRMDWPGAALAVTGLGALTYGLTALGETAGNQAIAPLATLSGAVLLVAFVMHERRADAPMMPLDLFHVRAFASVNALTLLLYFALAGALFFLPTTLIEAHGYSAAEAGSVFLPFTVVMALLSRSGGVLADRFGARILLTVGPILTGISFALLIPAVANGSYWSAIVPVMLLMGFGMGITVAPLSTTVMNAVSTERAGVASGINNAISRVAGLIAVAGLGAIATIGFQASAMSADMRTKALFAQATFGAPLPVPTSFDSGFIASLPTLYARAMIGGFGLVALICSLAAILSAYFGYRSALPPSASATDLD